MHTALPRATNIRIVFSRVHPRPSIHKTQLPQRTCSVAHPLRVYVALYQLSIEAAAPADLLHAIVASEDVPSECRVASLAVEFTILALPIVVNARMISFNAVHNVLHVAAITFLNHASALIEAVQVELRAVARLPRLAAHVTELGFATASVKRSAFLYERKKS